MFKVLVDMSTFSTQKNFFKAKYNIMTSQILQLEKS